MATQTMRPTLRHAPLLLLASVLGYPGVAAAGPFDYPSHPDLSHLHATGAMGASYDVVFIGDGYTKAQREKFFSDAEAISTGLLGFGPYEESSALVNAHALFVPSAQSGADHPAAKEAVETAFDATYDSFGITYLITAETAKILAAVGAVMPAYDLIVLIVNDSAYGGSGGPVTIVSTAPESLAILRHEVAHSIGHLADEYEAPNPNAKFEDPEDNVATKAHLSPLKWAHWVDEGTPIPTPAADATGPYSPIGAYEGARYVAKDMFRPAPDCLMRTLDKVFCPICREVMLRRFAADSIMLRGRAPAGDTVACSHPDCPEFSVEVADLEDLAITWRFAGEEVGSGSNWQPTAEVTGPGLVVAEVRHGTPFVRKDADGVMVEKAQWQVQFGGGSAAVDGGGLDGLGPADDTDSGSDGFHEGGCGTMRSGGGRGPTQVALLSGLLWLGLQLRRTRGRRTRGET